MATTFPFLRLPLELREAIYSEYFNPASHLVDGEWGGGQYRFEFALYHVNKQIHSEAENVFRRENVFVRIETPWPTAGTNESPSGMMRPTPSVAARVFCSFTHIFLCQKLTLIKSIISPKTGWSPSSPQANRASNSGGTTNSSKYRPPYTKLSPNTSLLYFSRIYIFSAKCGFILLYRIQR